MSVTLFLQIATMFLISVFAVIVPVLIGRRYGIYHSRKQGADIPRDSIGSVVGAAFGLLAFMLAFTFQIATNRWDARRSLLLDEVTDIRTAYLRAGLIPEPYNSNTRKYLVEYTDLRAELAKDQSKMTYALSRSEAILDTVWGYTEALARQDRSSEVYALYTSTINDLIDVYQHRVVMTLMYRIPLGVLGVLFVIVFLSMLILGYQFGISGKGSLMLNVVLAVLFSVVMFLIFALDRPETGFIKLNQKPMLALQKELHQRQLKAQITVSQGLAP